MNTQDYAHKPQKDDEFLSAVAKALEDFFDSETAGKINPLFLKNRTLTVSCANQDIASLVRDNQIEIVKKINLKLGKKEVDRIRYLL